MEENSKQSRLNLIEKATDVAAEGIIITDASIPENTIIYVNDGFERLTGYTRKDILGRNCRFLQGKNTDANSLDIIRRAVREGSSCTVELLNYRKDGTPFWNRLSITPIRDEKGRVTHFVGVQSDITELKNTKEELEVVNRELHKFHEKMTKELEQARRAQEFILPHSCPEYPDVRIASKFVPLTQIGGDFFDIVRLSETEFGIVIADVTGHGIPAALLTFMSSNAFKNSSPGEISTRNVMKKTNEELYGQLPDGTFACMFYLIYDCRNRLLTYTQAGNPPALLVRSNERITPLSTDGTMVGIFTDEFIQYEEKKIRLLKGDKVILFTDAIIETFDKNGDIMEFNRLKDFVRQKSALPIDRLLEEIYGFGLAFGQQDVYGDDITLVGMEIIG